MSDQLKPSVSISSRENRFQLSAFVKAVNTALPKSELTNEVLVKGQDSWSAQKIFAKTGIAKRAVTTAKESATDLAIAAAEGLLSRESISRESIGLLVYCTQSPDFLLPTTACIIQDQLNLNNDTAAFDFNLGCSGYVYGLSICKSLMESNKIDNALLLTADTYTKYLSKEDRSTRSIFGDGASATLLQSKQKKPPHIGPFVFGTDGKGFEKLILPNSANSDHVPKYFEDLGKPNNCLAMKGAEIFTFTLKTVPKAFEALMTKANLSVDDVDWFIFHQANAFMLRHLRDRCGIPANKFVIDVEETGNTVSTSIPLAITRMEKRGSLKSGQKIVLIGFGVGYSWAGCCITWN